jgi:phospholipid/cholesterol/gamma-HCH transport system ATP-binding protein
MALFECAAKLFGKAEEESGAAVASGGPLISFEHVSIGFDGRAVLDDVSFEVQRGETLCILGRSGVGKSVALRLLMGFLKPDAGSIRVEDAEIDTMGEDGLREIRKKVTMVFQNGALFDSLSVRENIAFPLRERGGLSEDEILAKVDRLMAMVGVESSADALPSSLATGYKRAVAMARALAASPEIVLYDEPTTMVDPIIAWRMGDLIEQMKQQFRLTSIVVTHDMRFAKRLADRILFLAEGKAHYFGPTEEFVSSQDTLIRQFLSLDAYRLPVA